MKSPAIALALGLAVIVGAPLAPISASAAERTPCFFVSQWKGWSAPEPGMLYLKVGMRDVYRVDLNPRTQKVHTLGTFLVSKARSSSICSHMDLDLQLADSTGMREPLFVRSLTKLTPEQVAAIPRKDRP